MTTTPEQLQSKIAQIAARYLDRIPGEIEQLRALVNKAAGGDLEVVREIEKLTHRIHGSGAMLHFDEISARAGELERMAADFVRAGKADQPRMMPMLQRLQDATEKAWALQQQAPR